MTEPLLMPFVRQWAVLLKTQKRDGTWVGTPVNVAVDGDRAYLGTPAKTAKVKRLRNFPDVEIAPCTIWGKPTGPSLHARTRLLSGDEAAPAASSPVSSYRWSSDSSARTACTTSSPISAFMRRPSPAPGRE